MRFFWKILLICLFVLTIALIFVGISLFSGIDDAYAQWGAADMVIDYMETHDGQWPPNWEALRKSFETTGGRVGGTFEDYQKRVFIDFHADPQELRRQSLASEDTSFHVIGAHWYSAKMGDGPNAMLREYFRRKAGIIDARRPKGGWPSLQAKEIAKVCELQIALPNSRIKR